MSNLIAQVFAWFFGQHAIFSLQGILLLSFLSSLLVFIPVPYLIPVALASNPVVGLDPTTIALYSSIGATAAKVLIFRASKTGRRFISHGTSKRIKPFQKLVSRYGWIAVFIAAATPLPDDLIYVPLGFVGYSLWRFALATFAGKLVLTLLVTWGARLSYGFVAAIVGQVTGLRFLLISGVVTAAAAIGSIYILTKIDWEHLLSRWFPWIKEDTDNTSGD